MKIYLIIILISPLFVFAQQNNPIVDIEVMELAPGLHRLFVANSVSVVVSHGEDGVLVIDAAHEQSAPRLLEEIRKLSDKPIKYLINTHLHADHTGGNKIIGKDADIIAHPSVRDYLSKEQRRGDNIIEPFPDYALPNILLEDSMNMVFNGEEIHISHWVGGHTHGDLIVYFPNSNVLMVGDLLFAGYFPYVDIDNGGHPETYMENVSKILNDYPEDVLFVGGHGPVYSHEQMKQWHGELIKTFAVIREAKDRGLSPDEMKQQRILKDWEAMGNFFITEAQWIDTLYPYL